MLTFNEIKKNLKKDYSGFKEIKVAILSDSASQLLGIAIKGYGYTQQLNFNIYEADFDQIDLQIYNEHSGLYNFNPDFIFINRSTEKLLSDFYEKDIPSKNNFPEYMLEITRNYYQTLTSRLKSRIIVNTFPEINDGIFGNFASKVNSSFIYQSRRTNLFLMELAQSSDNLFICDIAGLQSYVGYQSAFDAKMYVNAGMVYNIEFLPLIAKHLADIMLSISGSFKKCLILDLDETIWGGIIGDDGIEGIQLGHLGLGKVYSEIQQWARQLKLRGILLAVCSKNDEANAREPFYSHPDMVLSMDDIAVFVANWNTKADNIRHIQSVLKIGFDSMVFIDDNPFEREMVRTAIPGITVPDLPEDPAEYLGYLRSLNLFETASFTDEDTQRTRQYQDEAKRVSLHQRYDDEHSFLQSLHMHSEAKAFDKFTIPRVAQLTQRSNQFNLRTIRYTEEDIARIAEARDYFTIAFSLEDRIGDHGLISIVILKMEADNALFIDSWIMSCRVLNRGVEDFALNTIVDLAKAGNCEKIIGEYIPSNKNGIVKDHYSRLGFAQQKDTWMLDVAGFQKRDSFITNKEK